MITNEERQYLLDNMTRADFRAIARMLQSVHRQRKDGDDHE